MPVLTCITGAAGRTDPLGIVGGGLVAFHHVDTHVVAERADGAFQQAGLAGPRRAHQIHRQYLAALEPAAIALGQDLILSQNILLESDGASMDPGMQCRTWIGGRGVLMACP